MKNFSISKVWQWTKKNPSLALTYTVIAVFMFLRVWRLNIPNETVFDEVYFPKMAHQYLTGETFFDIHPPLGKLIIALGELIFGNTTVGWRVMSLLAGLLFIPASYWASKEIFGDRRAGLITALLAALDCLLIVYSRTGLMDGFMILFGMIAAGLTWRFSTRRLAGEQAYKTLLLAGLFTGLAVAIKWIGAGFLPIFAGTTLLTIMVAKKRPVTFNDFMIWPVAFVCLPAFLYTAPFLANWQTDFWHQFIQWHSQSWEYNVHLDATHPYASKWWSWPFLVRPIWFYYKNVNGNVIGVDGIGNPIIWWGSTLAVVYTALVLGFSALVWRRGSKSQIISRSEFWSLLFVLSIWASFYLPWVKIGRVLFLYHYLTSYVFALVLAGFWLSKALSDKTSRHIAAMLILLAVATGLAFVPIAIAYPVPQHWFDYLMWFRSWI